MKSAIIATTLFASLALATPLDKRYMITSWDYETVTVTVTGDAGGHWGGWGNGWHSKPTQAAQSPSSTSSPTPAPVVPTSTAAWSYVAPTPSSAKESPPQSSAASPSPSGQSGLSDYAAPILNQHNLHRSNHSAPALLWDDDLTSIAAQIAASCNYAHDTSAGGGGYGQNIGAGAGPSDIPGMITNEMYNDEVGYYPGYGGEPDMGNFENWGHFSQIVWADTTSVGCATQYCPGGLSGVGDGVSPYFTVCNYKPPGNFGGQYGKNVLAPKGDPSVSI